MEVVTMWSNGNSFSMSNGQGISDISTARRPVPAWKFGVAPESMNDDRGDV
jgi:hypothetical protein